MTDKITEDILEEYEILGLSIPRTLGGDVLVPASTVKAMATLALQSLRSAQAGEVEVVAWMATESPDGIPDVTLRPDTADAWRADEFVVTPLITLASHKSIIAAKDAEMKQVQLGKAKLAMEYAATLNEIEAAEARANAAVELLDHLIGWIVHDCGAEVPFNDEQDAAYKALNGAKP